MVASTATVCVAAGLATFGVAASQSRVRNEALLYVPGREPENVGVFVAGAPKLKRLYDLGSVYPVAVSVDRHGKVYVLDIGGYVVEYPRGSKNSSLRLAPPSGYRTQQRIAAADDGSFYENEVYNHNGESAVVQFGPTGTIVRAIYYSAQSTVYGMTTDRAGNLYVSVDSDVYVYAPHATAPMLDVKQPTFAGGLAVDREDELVVGLPSDNEIAFEALPSGKILRTIATIGAGDAIALDESGNYLYSVAAAQNTLQWFDFRTGRPIGFLTHTNRSIALFPGED